MKQRNLSAELDRVKRLLAVNFDSYLYVPDIDYIVYEKRGINVKILAVIFVVSNFTERGLAPAYWKLKLHISQITSHIKVYLFVINSGNQIIDKKHETMFLFEELDGIYFLKENFEETDKVKHFSKIVDDIKALSEK